LVRLCNGTESENLQLNGEETNGADEEAGKSRWMENVTEEPLGVDALRRGKAKQSRDLVGDSHEEGMGSNSVDSEEVVVCELDGGSRMVGGIGFPSLASGLEVVLETAPLVPFKNAVRKDEDENGSDYDDCANLGHLDKVTAEIVNHRGVDLITKGDRRLLGNGEDGGPEGDAAEGIIDLLLSQLKRSVEAEQ